MGTSLPSLLFFFRLFLFSPLTCLLSPFPVYSTFPSVSPFFLLSGAFSFLLSFCPHSGGPGPLVQLGDLEECYKFPSGSGQSSLTKRFVVHFELKQRLW